MKRLTTCNPFEADGLKNTLKQHGIECIIHDESTNKAITGPALPQTSVMVNEDDYQQAKAILDEQKKEKEAFTPWCPKCESENVIKETVSSKHGPVWLMCLCIICIIAAGIVYYFAETYIAIVCGLLALVFGVTWCFPHTEEHCKCQDCGHTFKR